MYYKIVKGIQNSNKDKINEAKLHFDSLIKPLGSLGVLEDIGIKIAGITGELENIFDKKLVLVFAADNGVHSEGVAASPKEITKIQALNIAKGLAGISVLAKEAGADIKIIDIGIDGEIEEPEIINRKISFGTGNILIEDAMTIENAIAAIEVGIKSVEEGLAEGYTLFGTGEMGIGNSTTSSTILSAITKLPGEKTVGYGAGLSIDKYQYKIDVVDNILKRCGNIDDPLEILSKYGGYDIASMTGVFLGCSFYKVPVVVDGFISGVAALVAYKLNNKVKDYLIFSHTSTEPGFKIIEEIIGEKAPLDFNMRLGEGTGCPLMFKMIDSSMAIIKNMGKLDNCSIDKNILIDIRN